MGKSYSGIRALADFIRDVTKYQHLGFNKRCILDPNTLVEHYQYDRSSWWSEISNEPVSSKNNIVSIHNPTLRFLTKWLAMVVHSRTDLRLYSLPEL